MAKPVRHPKGRRELLEAKLAMQLERGADPGLAFLHVPKTAGTGLNELFAKLPGAGIRRPVYLGHGFDMRSIAEMLPDARVILLLRDPLERIASGFVSRQRQGRPRYNSVWTPAEAVAFHAYRSPEAMFRACLSDDDHDISMSTFAVENIRHIRNGYVHYFGSAAEVAAASGRFALIDEMNDMNGFLERLASLLGASGGELASLHETWHASPRGGASIIAALEPVEVAALKARFAGEYRVWEALRALPAARG